MGRISIYSLELNENIFIKLPIYQVKIKPKPRQAIDSKYDKCDLYITNSLSIYTEPIETL